MDVFWDTVYTAAVQHSLTTLTEYFFSFFHYCSQLHNVCPFASFIQVRINRTLTLVTGPDLDLARPRVI